MRYFNKAMLVASAALCLNLSVFSQNITLKTGNVTVKEAMEQLKKSSGYSFVFSSEDLDTQKYVSISVQNGKIEDLLDSLEERKGKLIGKNVDLIGKLNGKNVGLIGEVGVPPQRKNLLLLI